MSSLDTLRYTGRSANHGLFTKIAETLSAWNDARVTRNALAKLSERELSDIGLTRYEADNLGL